MTQNPGAIKVRIDTYNYLIIILTMIIRNFAWQKHLKQSQKKKERKKYWQKIFAIYVTDKKLMALTYKHSEQFTIQEIK